ncbi:hypothetical protein CS344_20110 [Bordetella bronchiseptica]|nr:hypothetical protein CS344_20110 [Bordetella bronchiseptica]QBS70756.1 hypothetical protein B2C13_19800 [Bordetella bronchiseptica]
MILGLLIAVTQAIFNQQEVIYRLGYWYARILNVRFERSDGAPDFLRKLHSRLVAFDALVIVVLPSLDLSANLRRELLVLVCDILSPGLRSILDLGIGRFRVLRTTSCLRLSSDSLLRSWFVVRRLCVSWLSIQPVAGLHNSFLVLYWIQLHNFQLALFHFVDGRAHRVLDRLLLLLHRDFLCH